MKHPGPLKSHLPDRSRTAWRPVFWTLSCAAGWCLLYAMADAVVIDQSVMLVIAIIVIPLVVYLAATIEQWRLIGRASGLGEQPGRRIDAGVWPSDTIWPLANDGRNGGTSPPAGPQPIARRTRPGNDG